MNVNFVENKTQEEINDYINQICSDPKFLCSNKDMCGENSVNYSNKESVDKICDDISQAQKCDTDFSECLVNTTNTFDEDQNKLSTSFVNIILPIPNAYDNDANQKFLRLPALSSSKKPKSNDICNICACMNRFASSPGASSVIGEASYTSPGQNTCIYPDFIEHYYYPVSVQNTNTKLKNTPPVIIEKYKIINSNIIFAHSEQELNTTSLYDLLIKNGISQTTAINFILNVLYKNDDAKKKELTIYIKTKEQTKDVSIKNGIFYKNITFFYIILTMILLFLTLVLLI